MEKKNESKHTKRDIVIMIVIIIIIILLLLHTCHLQEKNGQKKNGNNIDICDGDDCNANPGGNDLLINCLEEPDNSICVVPDFTGKTEEDVYEWLNKISNNINITFQVYDSNKTSGTVIDQSNEKNLTVKTLLDNNIPLIVTFANSKNKSIDCLVDIDNKNCVVPDFTGKTKKDVYEWLNKISNILPTNFEEKTSKKTSGTVVEQSLAKGMRVIDALNANKELDIYFSNTDEVDCLNDDSNPICVVPNFTGDTQQVVEEWLESISNTVSVNYTNVTSSAKNKTIVEQSVSPGTSIKKLINNNKRITITFAKNESDNTIDCLKDEKNKNCLLPNFVGKTKDDITNWLNSISNSVPIRYETVESETDTGIILNQSIKNGTTVKSILDNGNQLVISVSKKKKAEPTPAPEPTPEPEPEPTPEPTPAPEPTPIDDPISDEEKDKLIVKDSETIWSTDTEVNIFENSLANTKIAPESSNTYRFSVNNNTDFNVKYTLSFIETNNYSINMKYKLRKNNSYIVDHYVSLSEINLDEQLLDSGKNDTYYLEWKWVSSDNDTEIGANPSASYGIRIEVEAEGLNE